MLEPGGHTSTVACTTPRNPYVMHGGYSVIQVELLHKRVRRALSDHSGTIPEQNSINVPDLRLDRRGYAQDSNR